VTKTRIEEYVIEQFLMEYPNLAFTATIGDEGDDGLEHAVAAERAYRAQLDNLDLRATIGDEDHDRLIASLHRAWQEKLAAVTPRPTVNALPAGVSLDELVTQLREDGQTAELRELLGSTIDAVFVRRAASRSHTLPIADRVKIAFHGDEPLDLPRQGRRFEPRRFDW
jgi:hypothetical protein